MQLNWKSVEREWFIRVSRWCCSNIDDFFFLLIKTQYSETYTLRRFFFNVPHFGLFLSFLFGDYVHLHPDACNTDISQKNRLNQNHFSKTYRENIIISQKSHKVYLIVLCVCALDVKGFADEMNKTTKQLIFHNHQQRTKWNGISPALRHIHTHTHTGSLHLVMLCFCGCCSCCCWCFSRYFHFSFSKGNGAQNIQYNKYTINE